MKRKYIEKTTIKAYGIFPKSLKWGMYAGFKGEFTTRKQAVEYWQWKTCSSSKFSIKPITITTIIEMKPPAKRKPNP